MAHKVTKIVLKDGSEYELALEWDLIEGKPELITTSELISKGYATTSQVAQVEKIAQTANENALEAIKNTLPAVSEVDNGKVLTVVNGSWQPQAKELYEGHHSKEET